MVGAAGFEPATSCAQGRRAIQAALRPDKNVVTLGENRGGRNAALQRGGRVSVGFAGPMPAPHFFGKPQRWFLL